MWNGPDNERTRTEHGAAPPGVVDSIGMGYEALLARPHLILPPVLLDLYLWLGVHLRSEPLMVTLGRWLRDGNIVSDDMARRVQESGPANLAELAAVWLPTIRMPSFISALSSEAPYRLESWRPALGLPWWGLIAAALLILAIGFVIGSEYLLAISATVTGRESSPLRRPFRETLVGALKLVGWLGVLIAVGLLVTWPLLAGIWASSALGAGASFWLLLLLFIPVSWGLVFFFFSAQAMFIDRVGPLRGLRSSYRVVRSHFWSSLGVICAYFLVTFGFPQVWRMFISEPLGIAVAILGHAIIGTGMVAATMIFYRDRARQLSIAGRN